jgi:outer membrane receptor protein involved in Fe transport
MPPDQAAATATQIGAAVGGAYGQAGTEFANQIAPLSPIFGAVETNGVPADGMVHTAAGFRTFGEIKYWGTDIALNYLVNDNFSVFANLSALSQNKFEAKDLGEEPNSGLLYALNVPKTKYRLGIVYAPEFGWRGNLAYQHDDAFFANFGQYSGTTEKKDLVDAGIGYKLKNGLSLDLTCTNLFNNKYRAFVNFPQIGRRAIAKLTYTFGGN